MSYSIVANVEIKNGKVFVMSTSNNVWPREFDEYEMESVQIFSDGAENFLVWNSDYGSAGRRL